MYWRIENANGTLAHRCLTCFKIHEIRILYASVGCARIRGVYIREMVAIHLEYINTLTHKLLLIFFSLLVVPLTHTHTCIHTIRWYSHYTNELYMNLYELVRIWILSLYRIYLGRYYETSVCAMCVCSCVCVGRTDTIIILFIIIGVTLALIKDLYSEYI